VIYICIPSYNEAPTVGLLLWKIRQVFSEFPREYQLLVVHDGSTDATGETLEPSTRVLPLIIPELVKQIESGADLVVTQPKIEGETSRAFRLVRRAAGLLLRNSVRVAGVSDVVSGFAAFRLVILRNAIRAQPGPLLTTDGWAANAELFTRAAQSARRIETVPAIERRDVRPRATRLVPWDTARELWRAGARLKLVARHSRPALGPERQPAEMI
jgi:hypothetical protein